MTHSIPMALAIGCLSSSLGLFAGESQVVSVADTTELLEALERPGFVALEFGEAGTVLLDLDGPTPTASGTTTCTGRVLSEESGSAVFAIGRPLDGRMPLRGVLRKGDEVYSLTGDSKSMGVVKRVNVGALPSCGNRAEHRVGTPPVSVDLQGTPTSAVGPLVPGLRPVIDLLVVYTPAARAGEGGTAAIEALIELAAAETNLANELSGLDHRVRVVHMAETNFVETGNHSIDLARLRLTMDGQMDEVHGLRNVNRADCVMLITDSLNNCGNGYLWNDPPNLNFVSFAFSVVSRHCAVSNLSFAHELGHNFGCDHEHGAGAGGAYAYSHGHRTSSGTYRTVMALPPGLRIPRFSDPSASEGGEALGVAPSLSRPAHNVESIQQVVPLIAQFRNAIPHSIGEGMTTSAGAVFELTYSGSNEVAAGDFELQVSGGVPNSMAVAFFGHESNATPFFGGLLRTAGPLQRLPLQSLDGAGAASWTLLPGLGVQAGQETFFQVYGFDASNPAGFGVAMSNGLRVEFR